MYIYVYICVCVWHVRPHFSNPGAQLRNMGGVFFQPWCCSKDHLTNELQ